MANEGANAVIQDDQTADAPDDGFTPEERAQFQEMQTTTSGPAPVDPVPATPEPAPVAAAPAVAPAAADDDDDEPAPAPIPGAPPVPADQQHPRRVSWSKYSRETDELRKKVEAAEGTIAQQRVNQAKLDERLAIINEALTAPPQQAAQPADDDPEPDPNEDIFGHNAWLKRQLVRTNQRMEEFTTAQEQRQQASDENTNLNNSYLQDANTFAAKEPNFVPAYQFLMESRVNELAHYFFGKDLTEQGAHLTPQEVKRITDEITAEERALVQNAVKGGRSPAQEVFKMARMRGFRPPAPAAQAPAAAPATNGAAAPAARPTASAAPPAAAAPAAPSVTAELARIRNGQDAALSLSQGGGAPAVTLDAARLANMPDDEFNALLDSMSESQRRAIMGG
jgi:hypothetical protein